MNLKIIEKALQSNKIVNFKTFEHYLTQYVNIYKGLILEDDWIFIETKNGVTGWNERDIR